MDVNGRVAHLLVRLGLHTPSREQCILLLLDDLTPSEFSRLRAADLPISAGATTSQIFGIIAPRLGKRSIDREARDSIMLPLREVGVLSIGYVDSAKQAVVSGYWKPKSPNNVYLLSEEFRDVLRATDATFVQSVEVWMENSTERLTRSAAAAAREASTRQAERLVPLTIEHYCRRALPEYEVIFVDDDDRRDTSEWAESRELHRLPLDNATRWPDIILRSPATGLLWIVDCVDSDGEIDTVRRDEIDAAFEANGHEIVGYTTAYRTVTRFAQRQRANDNVALGTYVWIMEIGGAHWLKSSIAQ